MKALLFVLGFIGACGAQDYYSYLPRCIDADPLTVGLMQGIMPRLEAVADGAELVRQDSSWAQWMAISVGGWAKSTGVETARRNYSIDSTEDTYLRGLGSDEQARIQRLATGGAPRDKADTALARMAAALVTARITRLGIPLRSVKIGD